MTRTRTVMAIGAALSAVVLVAAPASARYIPTNPTTSGQTNATLQVDDHATVSKDGFSTRWDVKLTCPKGLPYNLDAQVDERNPASIPELLGEDQGISSKTNTSGTCTGNVQNLHLSLVVGDTSFYDPALGTTRTVHYPIVPTPANSTNFAVGVEDAAGFPGRFSTQYCAAPACAEIDGPNLPIR